MFFCATLVWSLSGEGTEMGWDHKAQWKFGRRCVFDCVKEKRWTSLQIDQATAHNFYKEAHHFLNLVLLVILRCHTFNSGGEGSRWTECDSRCWSWSYHDLEMKLRRIQSCVLCITNRQIQVLRLFCLSLVNTLSFIECFQVKCENATSSILHIPCDSH